MQKLRGIITKHNMLIKVPFDMSIWGIRITNFAIAKTVNHHHIMQFKDIKISYFDLCDFYQIKGQVHAQIRKAVQQLSDHRFTLLGAECRWFKHIKVTSDARDNLEISAQINPDLLKYLTSMNRTYTTLKVPSLSLFTRGYSIKMYEFLSMHLGLKNNNLTMTVESVQKILNTGDLSYTFLKSRVLAKVQKDFDDLKDKGLFPFSFTMVEIKSHRKVQSIVIKIHGVKENGESIAYEEGSIANYQI